MIPRTEARGNGPTIIGFTAVAGLFDLPVMVPAFGIWLVILMGAYTLLAQVLKSIYIRINREWV